MEVRNIVKAEVRVGRLARDHLVIQPTYNTTNRTITANHVTEASEENLTPLTLKLTLILSISLYPKYPAALTRGLIPVYRYFLILRLD